MSRPKDAQSVLACNNTIMFLGTVLCRSEWILLEMLIVSNGTLFDQIGRKERSAVLQRHQKTLALFVSCMGYPHGMDHQFKESPSQLFISLSMWYFHPKSCTKFRYITSCRAAHHWQVMWWPWRKCDWLFLPVSASLIGPFISCTE